MTAKFIGNGNGLALHCNHGDLSFHETWPSQCGEKLVTGQIVQRNIRHYASTVGWLTVEVDGRNRDFCPPHALLRKEQLKTRRTDAERLKKEARAAREKADRERRDAWLAKLAGWKSKREEKERAKVARAAARARKRAAKAQLAVGASP
jgi:hypothetical protein